MKNIFRLASLLTAAVMLVACRGNNDDPNQGQTGSGKLEITTDKTLIQSNGSDIATLTVTLDGAVVKDGVEFFDAKNNPLDIVDGKFSVTAPGEYQVWATYGTAYSDKVTIRAITIPVPATPSDPKPASTDFKARVLLTQFTGVKCGVCPKMMHLLHPILDDPNEDRLVWVAAHTGFNSGDPAYLSPRYSEAMKVAGYPYAVIDHYYGFEWYDFQSSTALSEVIDECISVKKDVAAGIAVNVKLSGRDVVAKVSVKSPVNANYKLGGFLLEDGLYAVQQNADESWMNTHNACIRYIDAGSDFKGCSLGTIPEGQVMDYVFVWNIDEIWKSNAIYWKECVVENLRVAFFVSTTDANGNYYVNNAVECAVNSQLKFEYK